MPANEWESYDCELPSSLSQAIKKDFPQRSVPLIFHHVCLLYPQWFHSFEKAIAPQCKFFAVALGCPIVKFRAELSTTLFMLMNVKKHPDKFPVDKIVGVLRNSLSLGELADELEERATKVVPYDSPVSDEKLCVLCYVLPRECELVPCEHQICFPCSQRIKKTFKGRSCPYCRQAIRDEKVL